MADDMEEEKSVVAESRKNAKRGSIMNFLAGLALDDDEDMEAIEKADAAQLERRSSSRVGSAVRRASIALGISKKSLVPDDFDPDDGPRMEREEAISMKKGPLVGAGASALNATPAKSGGLLSRLSRRGSVTGGSSARSGGRSSSSGGSSARGGFGKPVPDAGLHTGPLENKGFANGRASGFGRTSSVQQRRASFAGDSELDADAPLPSWRKAETGERKVLGEVKRGVSVRTRI
jgi:hypothetical protein